MEAVLDQLVRAIDELPRSLANDEVRALLALHDRFTARVSAAIDGVDPAADGCVNLAQWLRACGARSAREAHALAKRSRRLHECPEVATAWEDGRLSTGQIDAVVAAVSDRTSPLFAEHGPE